MPTTSPTLQIRNEDIISYLGKEVTYLTVAPVAGATSLTVQDNRGLAQNYWIGLGKPGIERSEVVMVNAAVTAGTALTTTATVFSHPIDTTVIKLPGDKIEFFYATSKTATKVSLGSPQALDFDDEYSRFVDTANTTGYFFIRIYNSQTAAYVSDYIGPWSYSGTTVDTLGGTIELALAREGERFSSLITKEWMTNESKMYRRHMKDMMNLDLEIGQDTSLSLVTGQQRYVVPTGIKSPNGLKGIIALSLGLYGTLDKITWDEYLDKLKGIAHTTTTTQAAVGATSLLVTNSYEFESPTSPAKAALKVAGQSLTYTLNTKSTGTLSGIPSSSTGSITAIIPAGTDVWQGSTDGIPLEYCVWDGYIYFLPVVSSTYAGIRITIDFWQDDSTALQSTDALDVVAELNTVWLQWRILHAKKKYTAASDKRLEFFQLRDQYFGKKADVNYNSGFDSGQDKNPYTA